MQRIALLSVYDKNGIVEFAKQIKDLDFKIYASGGTFKTLRDAGVEASDVADLVGGGAILGHRVVTLSREIYAGLLSRETQEDKAELEKLKIPRIDLVCVDLYPLEEEIDKWRIDTLTPPSGTLSQREREKMDEAIIEKTDIGGPTLLRAAAKGRRIVVADAADRQKVVDWLKNGESNSEEFLAGLAAKAEYVVANYALISAKYHSAEKYDGVILSHTSTLKYGENAWQVPASLMADESARYTDELSLSKFKLLAGTSPSYNNWADVDRMLQTITHMAAGFDVNFGKVPYLAVGVKHGNACGASIAFPNFSPLAKGDAPSASKGHRGGSDDKQDESIHQAAKVEAIKKMLEGDLRAIFGGLVMLNFEVDEKLAEILLTHKMVPDSTSPASGTLSSKGEGKKRRLLDGIIAPSFTESAIEILKRKGDKCRFLANSALQHLSKNSLDTHPRFRYVRGGFLKQPNYTFVLNVVAPFMGPDKSGNYGSALEIIGELSESQKQDIVLAWAVGSTSNSNTVTIVKNGQLVGNGVGQQDRVGCCELAIKRAKDSRHNLENSTAYSDSFFPFPDGPQTLIDAGIKTIFATRGSVKDEEVKKVCMDNGVTFVTLPDSLARGFFGH